ncbi:MAG: NERD domain-containing protein [Nitrososphaerota archaeon]|jgi:hypothetical protein|nr:NERD domain-containing protein [Nitrososphaerota archaeon]
MRKIDGDSNYLKNQSMKYLSRAILSLLFFILIFSLSSYYFIFQTRSIGIIESVGFVTSLVGLGVFRYYQRKYRIYKGGRQGEKAVIKALMSSLSDDYYLINGVYLKGGGGDVDHIVLGPNGVYVLETKNWSGKIVCNGDQWQRPGKKVKSSPSLQVKRNTQKVRRIIDTSPAFRGLRICVEGLLIFTNTHADLSISNPPVTILRLQQLPNHIKNQKNNGLTKEHVQKIVKHIQNI